MASATPESRVPRHVAVIMDGNGRWAEARGLSRIEGHRAGAESVRRTVQACADFRIPHLTLYAFSTENWRRPRAEVELLMQLLQEFLAAREADLVKHDIRLNAIGQLERLPAGVRDALRQTIARTKHHRTGTLTLALSYGAREEIVAAARTLAERARRGDLAPEAITEATLAAALYTADLPDPDLIIRTSGEMRLSNFLLWQASYAEFYVTPVLWPDFTGDEFAKAIAEYGRRQRRYGGVGHA